jgi:hypothetical protein
MYRESERAPLSLYISCVMERGYNKLVSQLRRTKIHALFRRSGQVAVDEHNLWATEIYMQKTLTMLT